MPRETASERRVRRAKIALQWGQWLTEAMDAENVRTFELVARGGRLGGTFESGGVTHWRNGDNTADADQAVIVARALRRDPIDALRASGHDALADEMESRAGQDATSRREIALQWSAWVHERARERGTELAVLVDANPGGITYADIADWTLAKRAATSPAAIRAAIVLGADPYDALHASGHGRLAEQIQAINAAGRTNAAESRATNGKPA